MFFKQNPLRECAAFLFVYSLFALYGARSLEAFTAFFTILVVGFLSFFLFSKFGNKVKSIDSTLCSLFILFLTVHYTSSPFLLGGLTVLILAHKFFISCRGRPVFNPVAFWSFSLAILLPLFGTGTVFISWWGASFLEPAAAALLGLWCLVGLRRWRKYPLLFAFLAVNAGIAYFLQGGEYLLYVYTTGTIYFFAGMMLIEPKTSPALKNEQIVFGAVAACVYSLLGYFAIANAAMLSIILVNAFYFGKMLYALSRSRSASTSVT